MKPISARALYFEAPGRVALRQETLDPQPGQVLVESKLMGISHGTELLAFRGQLPPDMEADEGLASLSGTLEYPLKYGYLNSGITAGGKKVFAFYPHQDRFFANPEETVELPPGMELEDAVFLANMETALGIVHDAGARFGERILVIGQGMVGLLVAELLVRCGFQQLITLDLYPLRRQASQRIGCLSLSPEREGIREIIAQQTDGRGVDVAIDVSASQSGLQLALDCLAFSGTAVEASWYGSRRIGLSLGTAFHRRRLTLKSSQVSRLDPALSGRWTKERRIRLALELLEQIHPAKYITQRIRLAEAQQAFELLTRHPEETIQVVLEP